MNRAPQPFLAGLRKLDSPFTREAVQQMFPDLKRTSITVYLSHAVHAGLIEQVGFKTFRHAEPLRDGAPLSLLVQEVMDGLRGRVLPSGLQQLVVWSDEDLAPFVHDAIMEPFVVIEGSRRTLETVEDVLAPSLRTASARNLRDLAGCVWSETRGRPQSQVILLPTGRLHATRPSPHGFQVPRMGRLFLDVLFLPPILPDAALRMVETEAFDVEDAIAASPSKHAAARVAAFLAWATGRHPGHPARDHLLRLLPDDAEAW